MIFKLKSLRPMACAGLFLCMVNTQAASTPESSLWLNASGDSADTREVSLDMTLGFRGGQQLRAAVGRTRLQGETGKQDTDNWRLGWSGRRNQLRYGIDYEAWEEAGVIDSASTTFKLGWQGSRTGVFLHPQYRVITFTLLNGQKRDTDSTGIGLSVDHQLSRDWSVQASAWTYHYDFNPAVLGIRLIARRLSRRSLSYSSGFYNNQWKLGVTWQRDRYSIDVAFEQTQSAIDGERNQALTLGLDMNLNRQWVLRLEAGDVRNVSTGEHDSLLGVGIGYYWK